MAEEVPDLIVEQLLLGMLPPTEAAGIQAQLDRDEDPRVAAIAASNAEILEQYPPDVIAARLRRRLEASQRPRRRVWVPALASAALVAAAVLLWWLSATPTPEAARGEADGRIAKAEPPSVGDEGGVRIKGAERLVIQRKTHSGSTALVPGQTVRPGELVQLAYEAGGARHGVIASIDGAGAVTLHWPTDLAGDTTLSEGRAWLDHSFEFDRAPGFERFVFVTGSEPFAPRIVVEALQALAGDARRDAALELPEGLSQGTFLLNKPD